MMRAEIVKYLIILFCLLVSIPAVAAIPANDIEVGEPKPGIDSWPSMIGVWTLNYFWNATTTITFYVTGRFSTEGYEGDWDQYGPIVNWYYDSGTHYWGTINSVGDYMSGEMLSYLGASGTWSATVSGCPCMAGQWTLNFFWDGTTPIYFYNNGKFSTGGGYAGDWFQTGCTVDWYYESGTHYWGTITAAGTYMDGSMLSYLGGTGTWDASKTPLGTVVSGLEGFPYNRSVLLQWSTETEISVLGFNLFRFEEDVGEFILLNEGLINAHPGDPAGYDYTYFDRPLQNGEVYEYHLECIHLDGWSEFLSSGEIVPHEKKEMSLHPLTR